ncbi:MAG: endonuclease/exonuclease/phosphatase family protein [Planctomycetota bacterium]
MRVPPPLRPAVVLLACLILALPTRGQVSAPAPPVDVPVPAGVDLGGSFSLRLLIRCTGAPPQDLPALAANKAWESGAVRDYTTNNAYGLGRESGSLPGFAVSVLPDGAWSWNAGDGNARIDHRPEAADQGVADGRWHEVGFAIDRAMGVAHLFHDGRRVALHDLQGVGSLASPAGAVRLGGPDRTDGIELADLRIEAGVLAEEDVRASFVARLGEERRPPAREAWDGSPLRVLAWNIWHGGRRKGVDEGVQRVVEVIEQSGADVVLMQETYGSGPRIAGRLGFDFYLRSSNLSVLSRFPIQGVHRLFQGFRFGGATIELRPGVEIEVHSLWIHHLPDVGAALAAGAGVEELLAEEEKTRGAEMRSILAALADDRDARPALPTLVGGDFNSGSHLDWTAGAAGLSNHGGLVVPWPVSLAMAAARFVDTFRARHEDPLATPGHTWSPEFPDSHPERIDYVYASEGDWRVLESRVLSEHPRGWPSDHAAVLSVLSPLEPVPALKVMSYNIHYAVGMDERRDLERIAKVIADEEPDLVGLQEIGSKAMADELARLTGLTSTFGPSKGSDDAYGDAVLSRHPLRPAGGEALPSASSSRYQAMAVDVDLSALYGPGVTVRFVNTHFDWTDSLGSQEARRASVDVIERGLCSDLPELALLAGDLNARPGSPPLLDLAEVGWHLPRLGQPMATHGAPADVQIDYVLVRPRAGWRILDVRALDRPVASDHLPVVLEARPVLRRR